MATSLTTEEYYNGTGSQTNFAFTFPYFKEADVKVEHPIGTVLTQKTASAANDYEFLTGTTIKFTSAPASGSNNVKIYRDTDVDSAKAIFSAGSSIRASDLNTNIEQLLFSNQDKIQAAHITANTITNTEISDTAEIEVSKLKDGAARQVLQTDAAGTGVEWSSNIDIPGTLDVTGATNLDGTLEVAGATGINGDFNVNTNKFTVAAATGNTVVAGNLDVTGTFDVTGTSNYTGQQTVPGGALVKDIRVGLDGNNEVSTASGSLILDSASGTVQVTDHFNVTGNADVDVNLNVDGTLTVDGTSTLTGNVSVGGTVDGRDIAADGTKLDGIESNATADQTAAEIRTLVEAASDSNVFTDADHSKLNAIEAGATADQTNAEIRAAVEAASDSNVFTDADHSKLNAIEASATADQTAAEIRTLVEAASDSNVFTDADHSKLNAIEASATADQTASEIKTLYESNANTNALTDTEKAVIDGVTANTSELNTLDGITASTAELNITTGMSKATSLTSTSNTEYPTSKAVNDRIVELMQASGGFFPIADDQSFPNANPDPNNDAGTIVSIADAGGLVVNGSGVTTTGRTLGGSTVTINGIDSSLYSTTIAAGKGMLVQTTSTLNTYTYHRLTLDEGGVASAQTLVNDFNQRYRIGSSNPTSSLDDGDLFFNTTSDTMLVYNATASNWDEVQTRGNYFINTLSSFSGTGGNSASFNGSAYKFGLSHAGASAQQHIVSINGVLQKPNAGSSVPSEGFALDGSTIIFSSAPPAGSDYFIVTIGASVNIGTPSNNSVTSAMIVDGSIVNGDISNSAAIATSKLAKPIDLTDNEKVQFGTGNDLQIWHTGSESILRNTTATHLYIQNSGGNIDLQAEDHIYLKNYDGQTYARFIEDGASELYYDDAKKFETLSGGVQAYGNVLVNGGHIYLGDNQKLNVGASDDLQIYHDASGGDSYINDVGTGSLILTTTSNSTVAIKSSAENMAKFLTNDAVELYYDNSKKFETTSTGAQITGNLRVDGQCDLYDDKRLRLGDSADLQIYHDGTDSFIDNSTGGLKILGDTIRLKGKSADETMLKGVVNGEVELYHNNVKKFETSSTGNKFHGYLYADDDAEIRLGNGADLRIYHDGSYNYISSGNTTQMRIVADAWRVRTYTGSETLLEGDVNGAVKLYYDNSKKFETTADGIEVTGKIFSSSHIDLADNVQLLIGTGDDLQIKHDGANTYFTNNTGELVFNSDTIRLRKQDGLEDHLKCIANNRVEIYYNGSKKFETTNSGATITGAIVAGGLTYPTSDGSNGQVLTTNGSGALSWTSTAGGLSDLVGDTSPQLGGNLDVNTKNIVFGDSSGASDDRLIIGAGNDLQIYHDASNSYITHAGGGNLYIQTTGTDEDLIVKANKDVSIQTHAGENAARFYKNGASELYYDNGLKFKTTSSGAMVVGGEGAEGTLEIYADEGDDNADKWRFRAEADGYFNVQNLASGSWEKNIRMLGNGHVSLYYDNSKKLETTSTGIEVTGNVDITGSFTVDDNEQFIAGNSSDLKIYHDGSNGHNRIDAVNGNIYLRVNSTENAFKGTPNGNVEICYDGTKKLETLSGGVKIHGALTATADLNFNQHDNQKIKLGESSDLQIYHDGSHSYITNSGTGRLYINASQINLHNKDVNENMLKAVQNAAVELYYDNSKKFETRSDGVEVFGDLRFGDNKDANFGNSADLKIYHDGSNSYIRDVGTGALYIDGSSVRFRNYANSETMAEFIGDGEVLLYHNNSQRLGTTSTGLKFRGSSSGFYGVMETNDGNNRGYLHANSSETVGLLDDQQHWLLNGSKNGAANLYYDNVKKLKTESSGVSIDAGHLYLGDGYKAQFGASQDLQIYHESGNSYIKNDTGITYLRGNDVRIEAVSGERYIDCTENDQVALYYNNSKKFETTSGGAKVTGDLEVTGDITGGVGKVLQVITTTITGQQSGTNNSDSSENTTDLTGFSLNITPSSTSSKILLMASVSHSSTNWSFCIHAYRDSTIIAQGDALGGNRTQYTWLCGAARDHNDANAATTFHIIDSPSSTSQITYKLKGCTRGTSSTWHINRAARHASYNTGWIQSCVSTFTLMEIG